MDVDPSASTVIEPVTPAHVDALLAGDEAFERAFGLTVAPGYLEFPEALGATRDALAAGMDPSWYSHLFIEPSTRTLVGLGGYTGPPEDGAVEIGYSVSPEHRGRGHATAAARELIRRAREAGITLVRAHTLAEANPSTTVLERCGFIRVAELVDPEDGPLWRWELPLR